MKVSPSRNKAILFVLAGNALKASSRVRGYWIAEELEKFGFKCTLVWKENKSQIIFLAFNILFNDVIVFQKTYSRYHKWLLYWAKLFGKRVYMDIDDYPSRNNSSLTLANFSAMVKSSDGVWCGSSNLISYVSKIQDGKGILIPTSIKLTNYTLNKVVKGKSDRVILGWIGNGEHYKEDLIQILAPTFIRIAMEVPVKFKIIGACGVKELYDTFRNIPELEIEFIDTIEWDNPNAIKEAIADFDLGLYPLLENQFNAYKCGFKALEYMAEGIPVIASRIGANREIITHDINGLLVDNNDWVGALRSLITNEEKREELSINALNKLTSNYSSEKVAQIIAKLLE
jgi:glycosyltransferase involved in cell wall biosynthesis